MCGNEFHIKFCADCFNICFWLEILIVPAIVYFITQRLRPKIKILTPQIDNDNLRVPVENLSKFFDAHNLRIEICAYHRGSGYTYHFEPYHIDFLILPHKGYCQDVDNEKTFKSYSAAVSACRLLEIDFNNANAGFAELIALTKLQGDKNYCIRVRCHACHSFSGLGKSFEQIFKWDASKEIYVENEK